MKTKQVMPWVVIVIAVCFTSVDTFTTYEISEAEMASLYTILAPFGLASVVKAGFITYKANKNSISGISQEDKDKIQKILDRIQ